MQPLWAEQPKETKQVLVLYSEDNYHPAHKLTDHGIRSTFSSNTLFDVQLYNEYLDGSRFSDRANVHAEEGRAKNRRIDIRVTGK